MDEQHSSWCNIIELERAPFLLPLFETCTPSKHWANANGFLDP